MLAARDKENFVLSHAASKGLNQTTKYLPPKTPGNKFPKSPFNIPLNDENGPSRFGGGKTGLEVNGRGNENIMTGGGKGGLRDKNAFITPLGPRNRAPLGQKTTNAKAKVFPASPPLNQLKKDELSWKARPKALETTKLEVLEYRGKTEDLEPEYMPPRPIDLPDYPDDLPHDLDFSMFQNGGLIRDHLHHFATRIGDDGLSFVEREEKKRLEEAEIADKKADALLLREFESTNIPCIHDPECIDIECTANIENKRTAEEKYQKTMVGLSTSPKKPQNTVSKKPLSSKTPPSTLTSKSAAAALSLPKQTAPGPVSKKPTAKSSSIPFSKPPSLLSRPKRTIPPLPSNPSQMRHAALSAASKTTIGRSKGRVTSAVLKKEALAPSSKPIDITKVQKQEQQEMRRDPTLAPGVYIERYGVPTIGSTMWIRCKEAGCFDEPEHDEEQLENFGGASVLEAFFREEAEREFTLDL